MKKLKGFYRNNRIYCILMGISILCLLVIACLVILYFVNQTNNDAYGDRLDGIESVEITKSMKDEIINKIKENKTVDKVSINIKGKIIYINVYVNDGKTEDAKALAIKILDYIEEDKKEFYDINFSFSKEKDDTFPIMGYKKSSATIISWTGTAVKNEKN